MKLIYFNKDFYFNIHINTITHNATLLTTASDHDDDDGSSCVGCGGGYQAFHWLLRYCNTIN